MLQGSSGQSSDRTAAERGAGASWQHSPLAVFWQPSWAEGGVEFSFLWSLIYCMHRCLVFWVFKPHKISEHSGLRLKQNLPTVYFYRVYMIYVIIYDDRLCFLRFFSFTIGKFYILGKSIKDTDNIVISVRDRMLRLYGRVHSIWHFGGFLHFKSSL